MRQSTVNARQTISRLSNLYQEDREMNEELEAKYLALIQSLLMSKRQLEDDDIKALKALSQEYLKSKEALSSIMEISESLTFQIDTLHDELELKQKEIDKRKKINIQDSQIIEELKSNIRQILN